jgi:hypothetical protein
VVPIRSVGEDRAVGSLYFFQRPATVERRGVYEISLVVAVATGHRGPEDDQ